MEEMLDDTLNVEEDEEVEAEADEEVDKVLFELTDGKLGQAGAVDTELPVSLSPPGESLLNSVSCIGFSGRRRASREGDGAVQGAAQRFTQRLKYRPSLVLADTSGGVYDCTLFDGRKFVQFSLIIPAQHMHAIACHGGRERLSGVCL